MSTALYMVCIIMFLFQVMKNIHTLTHEITTNIGIPWLSTMSFPCLFRLVIRPGYDLTELNTAGYDCVEKYFLGQSMFNKSQVGWAGHTENGTMKGTVQGTFFCVMS